jgi:hypothetical protein
MKKPIEVRITAPRFFDAGMTAGLPPETWEALSPDEKITARLEYLARQAQALAATPWHADIGWPANVHGRARQLDIAARMALLALDAGDNHAAVWHALEAGKLLQEITRTIPALNESLTYRKNKQDERVRIAKESVEKRRAKPKKNPEKERVIEWYHEAASKGIHKAAIAGWIVQNKDIKKSVKTVRRWLKEAGLRD